MTAAACKATFSDFKLIRGRKVAQLVLEIPIEQADAALAALGGLPRPDAETWVGIARLDPKAIQAKPADAPKERRRFNELNPAQQAGIRCNDEAFWRYLEDLSGLCERVLDAERAAFLVRDHCDIKSRAELATDDKAAERWYKLDNAFNDWLRMPEHVA